MLSLLVVRGVLVVLIGRSFHEYVDVFTLGMVGVRVLEIMM